MARDRQETLKKLLASYEAYYNIFTEREEAFPLEWKARCEYFQHNGQYVISPKAELWSADGEEFLYLFETDTLTKERFEACNDFAWNDALSRANIGPGHMYTYVTAIFTCDRYEDDACKALRRCRRFKSFHLSLHGFMDCRTVLWEAEGDSITTNRSGRCVKKVLKKIISNEKRKMRQ